MDNLLGTLRTGKEAGVTLPRALLAVLVLTALAVVTAAGFAVRGGARPSGAPPAAPHLVASPPASGREAAAVDVLRAWDVRRARAWSRGDTGSLRRLYVARSSAGCHDVAMLRAWTRRGLRVGGMRMQLLDVDVRVSHDARIVLVVTDRLAGAVAVGDGVRLLLPRDAASTHTVSLRRVAGQWRVASVRSRGSVRPARWPAPR